MSSSISLPSRQSQKLSSIDDHPHSNSTIIDDNNNNNMVDESTLSTTVASSLPPHPPPLSSSSSLSGSSGSSNKTITNNSPSPLLSVVDHHYHQQRQHLIQSATAVNNSSLSSTLMKNNCSQLDTLSVGDMLVNHHHPHPTSSGHNHHNPHSHHSIHHHQQYPSTPVQVPTTTSSSIVNQHSPLTALGSVISVAAAAAAASTCSTSSSFSSSSSSSSTPSSGQSSTTISSSKTLSTSTPLLTSNANVVGVKGSVASHHRGEQSSAGSSSSPSTQQHQHHQIGGQHFLQQQQQQQHHIHQHHTSSTSSADTGNSNNSQPRKKQSTRDPLSHRMIEKRRRDRMNNCLTDLSRLIPNSFIKKQSSSLQNRGRIEKTEIIEMAIKYLKHLQEICLPILVDDGPLGPSPTTTPVPKLDNDHLFNYCLQQSTNLATQLMKDRFDYYRLGFHDCMLDTKQILNEAGLNNFYGKIVDHIKGQYESLNIAIISKCMMNSTTAVEDMEIHIKSAPAGTGSGGHVALKDLTTKQSVMYLSSTLSSSSPNSNNPISKIPLMDDTNNNIFLNERQPSTSTKSDISSWRIVGPKTSLETSSLTSTSTTTATQCHSLDSIRYLMDGGASPFGNEQQQSLKNSKDSQQPPIDSISTSSSPLVKMTYSTVRDNDNGHSIDLSWDFKNQVTKQETNDDDLLSTSMLKTSTNNNEMANSYHFKKEIKERFQKKMEHVIHDVDANCDPNFDLNHRTSTIQLMEQQPQQQQQPQINPLKPLKNNEKRNIIRDQQTSLSSQILTALSSLVSSFQSTTSANLNYVPVFALHPSGHYYVPMRIEASILGFEDLRNSFSPLWLKLVTQNNNNNDNNNGEGLSTYTAVSSSSPPPLMTKTKDSKRLLEQSIDNVPLTNGELMMKTNKKYPHKKARMSTGDYDDHDPFSLNARLQIPNHQNFSSTSIGTISLMSDTKPLLYPINITVNIAFNRAVSLTSLLGSIHEFMQEKFNEKHCFMDIIQSNALAIDLETVRFSSDNKFDPTPMVTDSIDLNLFNQQKQQQKLFNAQLRYLPLSTMTNEQNNDMITENQKSSTSVANLKHQQSEFKKMMDTNKPLTHDHEPELMIRLLSPSLAPTSPSSGLTSTMVTGDEKTRRNSTDPSVLLEKHTSPNNDPVPMIINDNNTNNLKKYSLLVDYRKGTSLPSITCTLAPPLLSNQPYVPSGLGSRFAVNTFGSLSSSSSTIMNDTKVKNSSQINHFHHPQQHETKSYYRAPNSLSSSSSLLGGSSSQSCSTSLSSSPYLLLSSSSSSSSTSTNSGVGNGGGGGGGNGSSHQQLTYYSSLWSHQMASAAAAAAAAAASGTPTSLAFHHSMNEPNSTTTVITTTTTSTKQIKTGQQHVQSTMTTPSSLKSFTPLYDSHHHNHLSTNHSIQLFINNNQTSIKDHHSFFDLVNNQQHSEPIMAVNLPMNLTVKNSGNSSSASASSTAISTLITTTSTTLSSSSTKTK